MKSFNPSTYLISILLGALFFLFSPVFGDDEILLPDSLNTVDTIQVKREKHQSSGIRKMKDTLQADIPAVNDTLTAEKKRVKYRSPQRAIILSAVLPGLGQAYNKKYWKIPIIYGVGAGLYYMYEHKDHQYTFFREAYENATNETDERNYQNEYLKASEKRGYAIIFMGILYVANVVDAMTDAYFLQYDISNDLSVEIMPSIVPGTFHANASPSCGISLNFYF